VNLLIPQGEGRPRYFEHFQVSFLTRSREEDSSSDRRVDFKSPTQLYLHPLGNPYSSPDLQKFERLGSGQKGVVERSMKGRRSKIGIDGVPSG
jgi:hypothetical protein